jgi:hypothetical protein
MRRSYAARMSRRTSGFLATFALIASGLTTLGASTPAAAVVPVTDGTIAYCTASAPPCLERFTRDGADVSPSAYRIQWNQVQPKLGYYTWYFAKYVPDAWRTDMGADEEGHTFKVTFNFGTFNPRTFFGQGAPAGDTPVYRALSGGAFHLTVSSSPIYRLTGCNNNVDPVTCPTAAPDVDQEAHGYLDGGVNDARWFGETTAEHNLVAGMWELRNAEAGGGAPILTADPVTGAQALNFTLQNVHQSFGGVPFHGFQHLRLPNAMLHDVYGIPDPDTMTSTSLRTTITGGSSIITITPEAGHHAMLIDLPDVTFSLRKVKVRLGIIVPTAPTHLKTWRISNSTGRIYFVKSYPRGARVTGYSALCANASTIKTASGTGTSITFTNISPGGARWICKVRAKSKAGYSPWSATVVMPRRH